MQLDASSQSKSLQSALGAENGDEYGVAFGPEASKSIRNKGSGYQLEQGGLSARIGLKMEVGEQFQSGLWQTRPDAQVRSTKFKLRERAVDI